MIELSSSWEIQGNRKLSDIIIIQESSEGDSNEDDCPNDTSKEIYKPPVILKPFLHPDIMSSSACCMLIRLATSRLLRIIRLVIVSTSPYIDIINKYGESVAQLHGIVIKSICNSPCLSETEELGQTYLFRCHSGKILPQLECTIRFTEGPQNNLMIQHIGIYTVAPLLSEPSSVLEKGFAETVKLSSFLDPMMPTFGRRQSFCPMSRRSTISVDGLSDHKVLETAGDEMSRSLYAICSKFLLVTSKNQPPCFWHKCALSLLSALICLSVAEVDPSSVFSEVLAQLNAALSRVACPCHSAQSFPISRRPACTLLAEQASDSPEAPPLEADCTVCREGDKSICSNIKHRVAELTRLVALLEAHHNSHDASQSQN